MNKPVNNTAANTAAMPLVLDLPDARATLEAAGGKGMSLTKMVAMPRDSPAPPPTDVMRSVPSTMPAKRGGRWFKTKAGKT